MSAPKTLKRLTHTGCKAGNVIEYQLHQVFLCLLPLSGMKEWKHRMMFRKRIRKFESMNSHFYRQLQRSN